MCRSFGNQNQKLFSNKRKDEKKKNMKMFYVRYFYFMPLILITPLFQRSNSKNISKEKL